MLNEQNSSENLNEKYKIWSYTITSVYMHVAEMTIYEHFTFVKKLHSQTVWAERAPLQTPTEQRLPVSTWTVLCPTDVTSMFFATRGHNIYPSSELFMLNQSAGVCPCAPRAKGQVTQSITGCTQLQFA